MWIGGLVCAYILGSIPSAVWISKTFYGQDVRNSGSMNAGLTNTFRVFGWKAALPVAIIDLEKGILSAVLGAHWFPQALGSWNFALICGILGVMGHSFTCFAGFRGGKGVLTAFGVYLFLVPWSALAAFGIWLVTVLASRYVSLASIASALGLAVAIFIEYQKGPTTQSGLILTWLVCGFVVYRHRENISRLLAGTENRFGSPGT